MSDRQQQQAGPSTGQPSGRMVGGIVENQQTALARLEKTNEMLEHILQLSNSRLEPMRKELLFHVQLLTEMKRNLDFVYTHIRKQKEVYAKKKEQKRKAE